MMHFYIYCENIIIRPVNEWLVVYCEDQYVRLTFSVLFPFIRRPKIMNIWDGIIKSIIYKVVFDDTSLRQYLQALSAIH